MDLKQFGKENKRKKRPDLAPLPKRVSPQPEEFDEPEEDFTDDQLAELFGAAEETACNAIKKDIIDLDDWMPVGLKPKQEKIGEEIAVLKPSNPIKEKVATFRSRTDMLFSSIELEPDSILGLRFQKREIPATQLKEFCMDSVKVRLTDALKCSEKNTWFTFGVVSDYSEMRQSGGVRIDLTDLSAEPFTTRVLIFNADLKKKLEIGSIVCIKNPKKAKPYKGKDALAVNSSDQVLNAGTCRDFSLCRGRKKGGGMCKNVVNTFICRFCKFHALSEYKNQKIGKDLKAAATGAGFPSKKPAISSLWNNRPSSKILTPARKNVAQIKKDQERLDKLNSTNKAVTPLSDKRKFEKIDSPAPTSAANHIAKKLCTATSPTNVIATKPCPVETPTPVRRVSFAKRKALEYARNNGGIVNVKAKKPVEIESTVESTAPETPIHRSEKFLSMMKEKPRDSQLSNDAETVERNKKFQRLEIVEEIGEKLAATHEVPVRAIRCLVCKKNYHQLPLQCVMNKHKCKVVAGTKRFFECNGCRTKTTTLEIVPVAECGKCGVWSWKKSGVAKNRVCQAVPQLSVRGFEETFVGSVVKDPNLNLLLPNDE